MRPYTLRYILLLIGLFFGGTVMAAVGAKSPSALSPLPGTDLFESALQKQLLRQYDRMPTSYVPRTRHLHPDGTPIYTNRLFLESSPYLQQHAHNPINWYPWGEAAFAEARRLNRPIFLSVGYATCHWCHVMEEESFENEEIAAYLNTHFIAIKVDREERPDVDAIYMQAVVAITGSGGWPMTVLLTSDGRPFYGGTYYPPYDGGRGQPVGLLTLLQQTQANFEQNPEQIEQMSQRLTTFVQAQMVPKAGSDLPQAALFHTAIDELKKRYDAKHGGLQGERKFPSSLPIRLLLRYHRRTSDEAALKMATETLHQMAAGGIYDQVGGGFHRYATDPKWRVPHFEKMLYDNAQLAQIYLEAYQVTKDPVFAQMVHHLLAYIDREMTSAEGVFYSATDADSLTHSGEREEGYFFTWTPDELRSLLGEKTADALIDYYGMSNSGNFEGRNILFRKPGVRKVPDGLDLESAHSTLYQARAKRPPPLTDDKIVTAWNGMMISALARAGMVFNRSDYIDRARRATNYLLERVLVRGQLHRSSRDGQLGPKAFIDDYALLTAALIDLYEATHSPKWLREALKLDKTVAKRFEDAKDGGFFRAEDQNRLIAREKPHIDGALPSGNAIAILNLLRLGELTFDDAYRQRAEKAFKAFAPRLKQYPMAFPHLMIAADFYLDHPKEIVLVTPKGNKADAERFLSVLDQTYLPNASLTVAEEGGDLKRHAKLVPVARGKEALGGRTSAYVCTAGICELPATSPELFAEQLGLVHPLQPVAKGGQP